MDEIGVFTPEQARLIWQDYQTRRQLAPHISQNYPQRRAIDEVSPHRVFIKNTEAGESIPAYGCVKITGTTEEGGRTVVTVKRPDSVDGEFLFNAQFEIAEDGVGWAYRYGVVVMLGDGEIPTAANVAYRPIVDEWIIEEGDGPFIVFGEHSVAEDALIGRFAGSGGVDTMHGIVTSSLGRGYYRVRLSEWSGTTPGESEDTICSHLSAQSETETEGLSDCTAAQTLPEFEETEDEGTSTITTRQTTAQDPVVTVLAFHRASIFVPLKVWSEVLMVNAGDTNPVFESDPEPVYQIVDGFQTHTIQYIETWECCDGVDTLISRKAVIFAALECAEETCNECEEP